MATKTISELNATTTPASTDVMEIEVSAESKKITLANLIAFFVTQAFAFGSGLLKATRAKFVTSIDDTNGNELFKVTSTGSAVNEITAANAATGNNPSLTASGDDTNVGIDIAAKGTGRIGIVALNATRPRVTTSIDDSGGNEVIKTPATASAVNEITATNAATGNAPSITATGDDTNIGLTIAPKGSGRLTLTQASLTSPRITTDISDVNGNEVIKTPATASAVNEVTVTNAATGNAPSIAASGGDANSNLNLTGKGTGEVLLNSTPVERQLSSTAAVDLNTTSKTTLFTCPAGKTAIVTRVVVRLASVDLTASASVLVIQSHAIDWAALLLSASKLANAARFALALPGTLSFVNSASYTPVILAAGETFRAGADVAFGSAATVTIDIFGYLF